ncbi:MAG: Ig-like domain-containing protein, partial [Actinomycetes bacterium]
VRASAGTLDRVTLAYTGTDRQGQRVTGKVVGSPSEDSTRWTASERLEPGFTYTLTTVARGAADAAPSRQTSRFTTQRLTLDEQTFPTLQPFAGSTVGVGMPVILTFDVAVKDKAEFERHLTVTSIPAQPGSWHWFSDKEVHFRPASYWRPGTKVTVNADLNSVPAGRGVYGQQSSSTSFTVGRSLVTKIDLDAKQARVYRNGDLVRRIPISAGKSGWLTRSGTKLIMEKLPVTRMTNEMIGAEESYDLRVRYAMRVTWSGEFLHAAPWNAGKFGRVNASHGCVGMSTGDASWLFGQVLAGDPVVTTGSSRGLEAGNGWTDWNVSYADYQRGSALGEGSGPQR